MPIYFSRLGVATHRDELGRIMARGPKRDGGGGGRRRPRGQSTPVASSSDGGLIATPDSAPETTAAPTARWDRHAQMRNAPRLRPDLIATTSAPAPRPSPGVHTPSGTPGSRPSLTPSGEPARPLRPSDTGRSRPGLSPSTPSSSAPPAESGGGAPSESSSFQPIYVGEGSSTSSSALVTERVVPGPAGEPVTVVVSTQPAGTMPWWGWALVGVGALAVGGLALRGLR